MKVARLPNEMLHIASVLWFLAGVCKRRLLTWELPRAGSTGLTRKAADRGLANLEAAGLVAVDRRRGRGAVVTLLGLSRTEAVDKNIIRT